MHRLCQTELLGLLRSEFASQKDASNLIMIEASELPRLRWRRFGRIPRHGALSGYSCCHARGYSHRGKSSTCPTSAANPRFIPCNTLSRDLERLRVFEWDLPPYVVLGQMHAYMHLFSLPRHSTSINPFFCF